jgi:hypothetical protein
MALYAILADFLPFLVSLHPRGFIYPLNQVKEIVVGRKNKIASIQGGGAGKRSRKDQRQYEVADLDSLRLAVGEQLPAAPVFSDAGFASELSEDRHGETVAGDSVDESRLLREKLVEGHAASLDLGDDTLNVSSAADGYRRQDAGRQSNQRKRQQSIEIADLHASGHGFLIRTHGSQLQRKLVCVVCEGPMMVKPGEWFCEYTGLVVQPDSWEWDNCPCNWCESRRITADSGYGGRGQPRKYCSHKCRLEMRRRKDRGEFQELLLEPVFGIPVKARLVSSVEGTGGRY